ncbi:hydrogenase maturation nickel metallochaperone HypA [Fructobacillus sp. M1-13]|uniref:Uncharacterized protein n=1 Tax=Fructobacillus papyriferae TaxID=2713171 RepID=A0ABS5QRN7_9LACO|nr:hypothetical protein [Fructobacillus papyriferae]MBS9334979.1 hypothetical protein [Fructobacillus papyriferae]MCD2159537.1 hydrogenase maturation nickel metallochaperone HypA [Fructobacillus papyriferae]
MPANIEGLDELMNSLESHQFIEEFAKKQKFEIECGSCGKTYKATSGKNVCPHCGAITNLNLTFNEES